MKNLLIIRLSAMGDVAMTAPVIAALRNQYPDLKITLLTRPFFQPFFRDIAGIEFFPLELDGRHKGFRGLIRLCGDLKKAGFDAVADLHDVLRTKIIRTLLRLSGSHIAHIDKGRKEKQALTHDEGKKFKPLKHTTERYTEVFQKLGFSFTYKQELIRKTAPIPELFGEKMGIWIGVAPFAQHRGKIYPEDQMREVVELLSNNMNITTFIFGGGDSEKTYAESLEKEFSQVISVIGKIKLGQELDLIANLDVMVCMDSAAMHMSSLQGVPTVSIWGATHHYAGFLGVGQEESSALQLNLDCRPCSVYGNKPCEKYNYRCLTGIKPITVYNRIMDFISTEHD